MVSAYKDLHTLLVHQCINLKVQNLDNEFSDALIELMGKKEVDYQLSRPIIIGKTRRSRLTERGENIFGGPQHRGCKFSNASIG